MSKKQATSAPVAVKTKAKDAEFLGFYNKATQERLTNVLRVTDPTGKVCVCEIEFSSLMKWNKEAEKADFSYIKISVKKPVDGEFVEVKGYVVGHSDKKNTKWVMVTKPEGVAAKQEIVSC